MTSYEGFLASIAQLSDRRGFAPLWMPSQAFDFQAYLIDWSLVTDESEQMSLYDDSHASV